jgi:hypothetical protein
LGYKIHCLKEGKGEGERRRRRKSQQERSNMKQTDGAVVKRD